MDARAGGLKMSRIYSCQFGRDLTEIGSECNYDWKMRREIFWKNMITFVNHLVANKPRVW
jgi:hypothetical protein